MKFDELFEQRSLVASKLKDCIRDMPFLCYQYIFFTRENKEDKR